LGEEDDTNRPLEEQLASSHKRIQALTVELAAARAESRQHKHEAEVYKRRLKVRRRREEEEEGGGGDLGEEQQH